jgi:hypothetical protein
LLDAVGKLETGWDYFKRGGWAGDRLHDLLADLEARARANEPPLTGAGLETGRMTLDEIIARDKASADTWFREPALGACGRAFIDRRWLLRRIAELQPTKAAECPTCRSPAPHRHPTNDFGEPSERKCPDNFHHYSELETRTDERCPVIDAPHVVVDGECTHCRNKFQV